MAIRTSTSCPPKAASPSASPSTLRTTSSSAGRPTAKTSFSAPIASALLWAAPRASTSSLPKAAAPHPLPVPRGDLTSFSPDGTKIAYLETSQEFRTWKRYRGGWSLPIAIYDLKKNTYEELPKSAGMDMFPMWHGNSIYFISDRDGVMNLYSYDLASKQTKKLTDYQEFDIKWPSLGPDAIVYENGGLLYEYNLDSGKTRNLPIVVRAEDIEARPEFKSVGQAIGSAAISPSGARAVVEARGNIFTVPAEHGSVRTLTTEHSSVHELNPAWSPDGKWIAYLSDKSGEYEIYTRPQMGGEETRITTDGKIYRYGPTWSPDSKKLVYWDKSNQLWYVSIDDKKPVLVDSSEYGLIADASWSPDSLWLTYSKPHRRGANDVFLYSLASKKITEVSTGFYNDNNPVFDDNGKYLYFISTRYFYPSIGQLDQRFNYYSTDGVFAVTLKADEPSPFKPESDEEKTADENKDEKKDEKKADAAKSGDKKPDEQKPGEQKEEKKAEAVKPIQIDLDGIGNRVAPVPIEAGILSNLAARKDKFFYVSTPQEARQFGTPDQGPKNVLHVYDVTKREDKVLLEGIDGYDLDKDGAKVLYKAGPVLGITDAVPGKAKVGAGKLDLSGLQVKIDPREEWRQIYHEAWRIERDFYWDPNMTGHDWNKIGARYEALLPWVAHRSDLNYLIGELIAELSTSHTYVGGGDQPKKPHVSVGMLGADFEPDGGFYRIAKIYPGENWNDDTRSPLTEPGLKVKAGDYLISVNGQEARSTQDVYSYFQDLAGKLVTLKINNKPSADGAWDITVKPIGNENGLALSRLGRSQPPQSRRSHRRPRRLHARPGHQHSRNHRLRQRAHRTARQRRHDRRRALQRRRPDSRFLHRKTQALAPRRHFQSRWQGLSLSASRDLRTEGHARQRTVRLRRRFVPVALPLRKNRSDRRHANLGRPRRHQSRRAAA